MYFLKSSLVISIIVFIFSIFPFVISFDIVFIGEQLLWLFISHSEQNCLLHFWQNLSKKWLCLSHFNSGNESYFDKVCK